MIPTSQPKRSRTSSGASQPRPASTVAPPGLAQREFEQHDTLPFDEPNAGQFNFALAKQILDRIEARLPGRIRHLTVFTTENAVVLAGDCSTFYSKQLAQHAAMGALDYEQLINNIEVRVPK